jgi:hypothetical protein
MRIAMIVLSAVVAITACGEGTSSVANSTPSSGAFGTATLFDDRCDFAMPDKLPIEVVTIKLVNSSQHTGRFILAELMGGHTVQDVIDYKGGGRPDWATDLAVVDVLASKSGEITSGIPESGTYLMHCGWADATGFVHAFWHQLRA